MADSVRDRLLCARNASRRAANEFGTAAAFGYLFGYVEYLIDELDYEVKVEEIAKQNKEAAASAESLPESFGSRPSPPEKPASEEISDMFAGSPDPPTTRYRCPDPCLDHCCQRNCNNTLKDSPVEPMPERARLEWLRKRKEGTLKPYERP